ncbi:MAG: PQQ-binding-like beta-propeller repeat protein [Candidatus Limnocylindrales bacterium]
MSQAEPQRAAVQYPGGLAARYRWAGSGQAAAVFALSEAGGTLTDHGPLVSDDPDRLCRAELRIEGPLGTWTARFASPIFDVPAGLAWDSAGLLVVRYGFRLYALVGRTGELRWSHALGTPIVALLGSSRLPHVIVHGEIETVALRDDGSVAWRAAHDDVVTEAELVGGRLVLTRYDGRLFALDPLSGRAQG